jgi:glycosyltransferase involved in cell wall biosynthesis
VIGGEPRRMRYALAGTGVQYREAPTVLAAIRALLSLRPDLVHAHMTAAETAAVATAPLHRAPVITTRHFAAARGSSVSGRAASPVITRLLRAEIAISNFVAEHVGRGAVVIPNAVADAPAGVGDAHTVLVAQRLEAEKDTALALRAWALSSLRFAGWRLVIAGRGSQEQELLALARVLGISDSVHLAGFVDEIELELSRSAVLLAPAPAEPFGLTVAEAMARGVPVIAAGGGAHIETVGPVSTEWLFTPGDAAACAALLDRVPTSREGLRAYGQSLRTRQRELYSLAPHVDRLVRLYREVGTRDRPPAPAVAYRNG